MELEHAFTVPLGVDDAAAVLGDFTRIGPCLPGTTIESSDQATATGKLLVKVGPIQVTYRGEATLAVSPDGRTGTITARGKEARGSGTAVVTVVATLVEGGRDATEVQVRSDLDISGRPAQFGRGVMADVADKLVARFAECLASKLATGEVTVYGSAAEGATSSTRVRPNDEPSGADTAQDGVTHPTANDHIDLVELAGPGLRARIAPIAVGIGIVALVAWLIRRRR